jgi:hypothetical protein
VAKAKVKAKVRAVKSNVVKKRTERKPLVNKSGKLVKGHHSKKFTPERTDIIIGLLKEESSRKDACVAANVSITTFYNWMYAAERHLDEADEWDRQQIILSERGEEMVKPRPEPSIYNTFHHDVLHAEMESKKKAEGYVKSHRVDSPAASMWWLERKFPLEYGNASQRPGIGINARASDNSSEESDPETELLDAISAFEERIGTKTDN